MRDYCNKEVSGRPIKEVNDAIIYAYVNGVIGTKQFKELSGMSEGTHIADLAAFREYKRKHGILKVRNNVDILLKHRGVLEVGQKVGQIIYEDGTVKDVVFKKAKKYHGFR
jgi:hypothetical protein